MDRAGAARSTGRTRGREARYPTGVLQQLAQGDGPPGRRQVRKARADRVVEPDSTPRSTSPRATAPLKALEVLAMRMYLLGQSEPRFASATPAVRKVSPCRGAAAPRPRRPAPAARPAVECALPSAAHRRLRGVDRCRPRLGERAESTSARASATAPATNGRGSLLRHPIAPSTPPPVVTARVSS